MKNKLFPAKTDCAFYNERRKGCNILCEMLCVGKGKCSFYKTEEQRAAELKKFPKMEDYSKRG